MKKILFPVFIQFLSLVIHAQAFIQFPQQKINEMSSSQMKNGYFTKMNPASYNLSKQKSSNETAVFSVVQKMSELKQGKLFPSNTASSWIQFGDTIVVGYTPNDTLKITGNWTHYGPILVLGDGVLIFDHATVIDTGDIYVFQNGKMFCDSSSLTFPQQYFYQRGLYVVQNGFAQISNTSFNYSGMSHNLVIGDSAQVTMTNIHQNDWTTCALFSRPSLSISNCNITGEYILSDSCTALFHKADTIILWHHVPIGATVNYTFPNGINMINHDFYNGAPGVNGIKYLVHADTCENVMWALMPDNGSSVTISNSTLRAIGAWFRYNDTVMVNGLYDSTSYTNFAAPLSDRILQLNNTYVQTWSLYVFDKSHIDLSDCQVGEVGTQQRASVTQTTPFLLDGTGGYYWCTDTSAVISWGAVNYSFARSEKNGLYIMAYDWVPFTAPTAIGNSIMVCIQSNAAGDPMALESSMAWMAKLEGPDTALNNSIVPIQGSSWLDHGPNAIHWMDYQNYSVSYTPQSMTNWQYIVHDSIPEIHHNTLVNWNTGGIAAGDYYLKLTVKNNLGDSVEAIYPIVLNQNSVGINYAESAINFAEVFPVPATEFISVSAKEKVNDAVLTDLQGKIIQYLNPATNKFMLDVFSLQAGTYLLKLNYCSGKNEVRKILKQ